MGTLKLSSFVCAVLMAVLPAQAMPQSRYADSVREIKGELRSYQSQLEAIDRELVTFTDCERLSDDYLRCTTQMDVFYNENMSFITLQSQILYDMWMDIMVFRKDIEKKMEKLQQEAKTAALARDLETEFTLTALQYDRLTSIFQQLPQMKRRIAKDTLVALKNRDMDIYPIFVAQKNQHKDIIASEPMLDSLCKRIESGHKTISEAQNIETVKWGDIIFKVTIVAALLAFLINIIVSKKTLNNQMNGKKKKKFTPSI